RPATASANVMGTEFQNGPRDAFQNKSREQNGTPATCSGSRDANLRRSNAAVQLEDLRVPPGNYLEALAGDRGDNIRSGSTTSSESVFAGRTAEPRTWKSATTIRRPA